jgi:HK97 family phage portal protein
LKQLIITGHKIKEMKIFGFNIERQKAQPVDVIVNEELLYRMLFETMSPFIKLKRDSKMLDTITDGYEVSPDVFSITNKVITMFSGIPYKVFQGETEIEQGPIEKIFEDNLADYTFDEFRANWEAMGLVTGNSIVYHISRSSGGEIIHFQLAPTQHVEILYGDWMNPVKGYTLDLSADDKKLIPPENMWHVRQFPNLDFREGKNYMGISPIRVAARVINSQIFGQEIVEASYKRGMPPGILTKKDTTWNIAAVEEQRKDMEAVWEKKYAQRARAGKPIFTVGDLSWIPIGFSNFNDLKITEVNVMAMRVLCNMWGVPSRVMNDMEGGSYTKDKEDRKAIYTNRLIPDNAKFWSGINRLIQSTGIRYEPNYDEIPELQEDKLQMAQIFKIGYDSNAVQVNEFRAQLQLEEDPEMEGLYRNDVETNPNVNPLLPPDKL